MIKRIVGVSDNECIGNASGALVIKPTPMADVLHKFHMVFPELNLVLFSEKPVIHSSFIFSTSSSD